MNQPSSAATSRPSKSIQFEDGDIIWKPSQAHIAKCSLTSFVHFLNRHYSLNLPIGDQESLHRWTIQNSHTFWFALSKFLYFPLHPSPSPTQSSAIQKNVPTLVKNITWFPSYTTNFTLPFFKQATIRPHVTAITSINEHGFVSTTTFLELKNRTCNLGNMLKTFVKKGDSIGGILINDVNAVIALLSSAAIGAVFSCCSCDFGENAIINRFSQTKPVVLFYSSFYTYKGIKYDIRHKIKNILNHLPSIKVLINCSNDIMQSTIKSTVHLNMKQVEEQGEKKNMKSFNVTEMNMMDPVVIMFSSGTTGKPKCLVQGTGILLNQMKEHSLHMEVTCQSIMFFYTSTGWMMFNWLVSALTQASSIILYDGSPHPINNPYFLINLVIDYKVTHFGCGASILKSFSSQQTSLPMKSFSNLQTVMGTGSPSTKEHFQFVYDYFGSHVQYVSISGGSDINGCFALGSPWKCVRVSQLQCIGLGMDVNVFNESGNSIIDQTGELICKNSLPCMPLYFQDDSNGFKYHNSYFRKFGDHIWNHGDFAVITSNYHVIISGRSDSTLNPNGIRIGTSDIYHITEALTFIQDSLVIDIEDVMILFIVMKQNDLMNGGHVDVICKELKEGLSPKHVPGVVLQVDDVPYTFSGKKCEIPVKRMLMGKDVTNKDAVRNPEAFDHIFKVFQRYLTSTTRRRRRSKL